jgi:TDG/mug DNA glycosylase family protein
MTRPQRPTRAQVLAAAGRTVPDVIAPGLRVLFCGINPGLYSGATGHHFARPGNRFWPVLHAAGFTGRVLAAWEERELLEHGYGVTNLVARATATAAELSRAEFVAGARRLARKVRRYGAGVGGGGRHRRVPRRLRASQGGDRAAAGTDWSCAVVAVAAAERAQCQSSDAGADGRVSGAVSGPYRTSFVD